MSRAPDQVLDALGDETRRQVFLLLRHGPRNVRDLAEHVTVSRPAVSQHLRVLEDAHLVTATKAGRERWYQIDRRGLAALRGWVDGFWDDVLGAFADEAAGATGRERIYQKRPR